MQIKMPVVTLNLIKRYLFSAKTLVVLAVLLVAGLGFWFRDPISSFASNFVSDHLTVLKVKQRVVTEEEAAEAVVDRASPAVVSVLESKIVMDPFSGPISQKQSIGTGFIVRSDGIIITNRHVVADTSASYTVVTKDGKEYLVKEVHRDTLYDLAIIKVEASGLPVLALGDSDKIKVGQTVLAIGNALGEFSNSVTRGIVSGIGRRAGDLEDAIQTDAAINPGNSGGPLLNLSAEVVGINAAIISGSQGIGFAIPINVIKPVVDQFEATGKIIRPFLGVTYYLYTQDEAKLRGLPAGAFVTAVTSGSGADRAGVEVGDVITAVDGQGLIEQRGLLKIIASHKIGDVVTLTINRNGTILTLRATLGELPSQ